MKLDCFNAYFASFCVRSPQSKTGAADRPGPRPGRAGYRAAWDACVRACVRRYRGIFGTHRAIFGRRANLGARASPLELEMLNIGIGCSGSGVMSVLLKLVAETSTTATTPACHAVPSAGNEDTSA